MTNLVKKISTRLSLVLIQSSQMPVKRSTTTKTSATNIANSWQRTQPFQRKMSYTLLDIGAVQMHLLSWVIKGLLGGLDTLAYMGIT